MSTQSRAANVLTNSLEKHSRLAQVLALCLALFCLAARPARAQLATSFYTITGIETRRLPNAVQMVIRTDGAVIFGGDLSEWIDFSNGFEPKFTTQFRLRLLRARARVPAFNNIGAYPLDSAQVTLGRDAFKTPYFPGDDDDGGPRVDNGNADLRVDIALRFFVPVKVQQFGEIRFGRSFDPLEVEVRLGNDRRSIVVTVITDRLDPGGAERIRRVKPADQRSQLALGRRRNGDLSLFALHVPLPDLLAQIALAWGQPIVARPSLESERVSLQLDAPPDAILRTLAKSLGLSLARREESVGGGWEVGGAESLESRRIPLQNLSPERARLLLPDWLLPFLRADVENNALIAYAAPSVLDKIQRDLQVLDRRRALVRVQAEVYEVSLRDSEAISLSLAFGQRGLPPARGAPNPSYIPPGFEFDGRGVAVVRLEDGGQNQRSSWRSQLEALRQRGRVRLRAKPFVLVLSGETGRLFLGQSRFIPVLRSRGGQQDVQALNVPIGYSLEARPRVSVDESKPQGTPEINIDISPRASTVDEIESGTGLPTIGIREVSTNVRLRAGDAILVAGLDVDNTFSTRSKRYLARRGNSETTRLLVIVTAQII